MRLCDILSPEELEREVQRLSQLSKGEHVKIVLAANEELKDYFAVISWMFSTREDWLIAVGVLTTIDQALKRKVVQ